jgi:hypothetical protein
MATGTRINFVYPCNHAETVNGLIYVHGGGWTHMFRQLPAEEQQLTQMGVVVGLTVPWMEIGNPHEVTVSIKAITSGDSGEPFMTIQSLLRIGPQPFTREGVSERVMLGIPLGVVFPKDGAYQLIADVDDNHAALLWDFWVHDVAVGGPA